MVTDMLFPCPPSLFGNTSYGRNGTGRDKHQDDFDVVFTCSSICMLSLLLDFPNADEAVNVKEFLKA